MAFKAIETQYKGYEYAGKLPNEPKKSMSERANLTNKWFGRLLAIESIGVFPDGSRLWGCICDCGTKKAVRSRELIRGHTKSCGCLQKEIRADLGGRNKLPKGIAAANSLLSSYRKSARQRGYSWELSKTEFYSLTSGNCYYCGQEPFLSFLGNSSGTCNGAYTWNGIDRVDNSKGYTSDNTVTCCKVCNVAKASMTQAEFVEWIRMVYDNLSTRFEFGESGHYVE